MCTLYSISSALLHLLKYIANIPVACCSLSIDAIGIVNEKHKIHSRFIQIFNNDNEIASQMQIIISIITIKAYSEPVSTLISIIVRQHCLNLGTKWSISFAWTHPTNAIHKHTSDRMNTWICELNKQSDDDFPLISEGGHCDFCFRKSIFTQFIRVIHYQWRPESLVVSICML